MAKKIEISDRKQVHLLVTSFYQNIRQDDLLGPIFNAHIKDHEWPEHLDKLTDFWETNLFGIPKFKGSPTQKHRFVDASMNYSIDQAHFGRWLQIWFSTIDEHFIGDLANKAKESARRMAHSQFMMIWQGRP